MVTRELHVLIVEDEALVALYLEDLVRDLGHRVVATARRAEDALAAAATARPDVAIVDIRLAGRRDGTVVAAELRARHGVPSVLLSAEPPAGLAARAAASAPLAILGKPFRESDLRAALARLDETTGDGPG